jgi:hypothetical protein
VASVNDTRAVLSSLRVRAGVAAAAGLVLIFGFLLRPATQLPATAIEEAPAPILQEVMNQRDALTIVRRLQDLARQNVRFAARLTVPEFPLERWSDWNPPRTSATRERYAVVVAERRLVGAAADLPEDTRIRVALGDGRQLEGRVGTRYPVRGLAFVDVTTSTPLQVPATSPAIAPGDAVVGAAPSAEQDLIIAPLFVAGMSGDTILLTSLVEGFDGMPVFSEAGVVGLIARAESGTRMLSLEAALRPRSPADAIPPVFGVSLQVARSGDGDVNEVAVQDVAPEGAAAKAGLRPGDVLIDIDGVPVRSLEDATGALTAGTDTSRKVRVRRGRRTVVLDFAGRLP